MPLLILLVIFIIVKLSEFFDWLNTNVVPFSSAEMQMMRKQMSGKSQYQCRQILNQYSNGKRRWQNWF